MAKHTARRRRRSRKYLRGNVDEDLTVGALIAKGAGSGSFDESVNERTLVSSIVATWTLDEWTVATGTGPLVVGVCHSDYTTAEIEAFIENAASWNEGDKIGQEIAKRLIRRIGEFDISDTAVAHDVLNDGKPIKTKLNWMLLQGQTLRLFFYNTGTATISTATAAVVRCNGHVNLWPQG